MLHPKHNHVYLINDTIVGIWNEHDRAFTTIKKKLVFFTSLTKTQLDKKLKSVDFIGYYVLHHLGESTKLKYLKCMSNKLIISRMRKKKSTEGINH